MADGLVEGLVRVGSDLLHQGGSCADRGLELLFAAAALARSLPVNACGWLLREPGWWVLPLRDMRRDGSAGKQRALFVKAVGAVSGACTAGYGFATDSSLVTVLAALAACGAAESFYAETEDQLGADRTDLR